MCRRAALAMAMEVSLAIRLGAEVPAWPREAARHGTPRVRRLLGQACDPATSDA
jgi:hypothetical protein